MHGLAKFKYIKILSERPLVIKPQADYAVGSLNIIWYPLTLRIYGFIYFRSEQR